MTDPRIEARKSAQRRHEAALEVTTDEYLEEHVLEVSVWKRVDSGAPGWVVEYLLCYGGPTVRVRVDSRWPDTVDYMDSAVCPDWVDYYHPGNVWANTAEWLADEVYVI
tara:strand:- start:592 stop:918 length:327 start_codon:yes stop_codon:yes gene_type:complete